MPRQPGLFLTLVPLSFSTNESLDEAIARNVLDALREDIGTGDLTADLLRGSRMASTKAEALVLLREQAVVCGRPWFDACFARLDEAVDVQWNVSEGEEVAANEVVCRISGSMTALVTAERSALNFLQMLSGVASQTRRYVKAIEGLSPNPRGCRILDTRKTLPGLRHAQKYAVRMGGGTNHRLALWDAVLVKENHIEAAGGLDAILARLAQQPLTGAWAQVEVETLEQLERAVTAGATMILLDNFDLNAMTQAVALAKAMAEKMGVEPAVLEASGGLGLQDLQRVAATGVDRISIGQLTKSVMATDYSMRMK
ncbi:MAG: carboxylating nicotinate-nucleotide diphosphorylase [Proteobacteria bacterium]|jgi:nicotinate-nucleotide pyrophosphorylase (carboxylating)|nr:carboxylating nicotinate-nucleotide diphosphorylase [Pseudomonadota bacterium]